MGRWHFLSATKQTKRAAYGQFLKLLVDLFYN